MKFVVVFIFVFVAVLGSPVPQADQWHTFGKQLGARISNTVKGDDSSWQDGTKAIRGLSQMMFINPEQIQKIVDGIQNSQPHSPESSVPSLPNAPNFDFKLPPFPMVADIENKID